MKLKTNPKTAAQLQAEISYFEQQKQQTKSVSRLARLDTALRIRREQLSLALRVRPQ